MSTKNTYMHELRRALFRAAMPDGCKLLMYNFANFSSPDGRNVRPSNGSVELGQEAATKTLRNYRRYLEQAGWLKLEVKGTSGEGRGGARRTNEYSLHIGRSFKIIWHTDVNLDTGKPTKRWELEFIDESNDMFLDDDYKATRAAARTADNVSSLPSRPRPQVQREVTPAAASVACGWSVDEAMDAEVDFDDADF